VRRGGFNGMTSGANSLIFEPSCSKNLKYVPGGIPEPPTTLALRGQFKSVQKLIGSCKIPDTANSTGPRLRGNMAADRGSSARNGFRVELK
jgi:hypothetical protein